MDFYRLGALEKLGHIDRLGRCSAGLRMNKKQGKGDFTSGSSTNRYQALISPIYEDYELRFPVLLGAKSTNVNRSRAPKRGLISPVNDGRQLEKIAEMALNQAKQGIKPLSKGDFTYFETWLTKYRSQTVFQPTQLAAKTRESVSARKEEISKDFVEETEWVKDTEALIDIGEVVAVCGNGGADVKFPISSVSVVRTVRIPTSGLDEDDGTIYEEEESVAGLRTNTVSEDAVVVSPLNQTRAVDSVSFVERSDQGADGENYTKVPFDSEVFSL
ncbi:hypothetical protein U1Q18_040536 [Sarracenia purpurea var. burkii]